MLQYTIQLLKVDYKLKENIHSFIRDTWADFWVFLIPPAPFVDNFNNQGLDM